MTTLNIKKSPQQSYRQAVTDGHIQSDAAQKQAVKKLQKLFDKLLENYDVEPGLFSKLKNILGDKRIRPIKGLYFWGGVGRGKTFLVDLFYDSLPFDEKLRMHFHRFMQMVHEELKQCQDQENPLDLIAEKIASQYYVICFDEFHVADITDAMLLAGLFNGLFDRGVSLVATSNIEPDNLYAGGLQRERFLPAIDLIKQHTSVFNLDSGIDYRLRYLDKAEIYHYPLDEKADELLHEHFEHLAPDAEHESETILIEGREINTIKIADSVIWFDFLSLCDGPRGAADYIEIARCFQTVILSEVPIMDDHDIDKAKRFMTFIDETYDRNVKLIITAADKPEELYTGVRLADGFQRTISRLNEMASHDYLARQHIP